MVTINDIARLAHVDKGAVSRTLRNHRDAQRLRPETRERILRIAAELGYQPNQLASSTRTGIVRSIALIGHFFNSTLYFSASQIISGILSESTKQGYGVKMYDSADLKKAFAEIVGNRIRYLLSFCAERPAREEQARFCRENGIQIVYLYEHAVGEYPAVNIDNLAASSMLVHHLAERGHRRIALLCVPHREELYSYVRERHEGYFRSMKELGLPVDPDLVSCSDDVESYHSWSSNGRWVVFSSRRNDGNYTRPFLAYIDKDGKGRKPFELPQDDPDMHRRFMKSYNIPEFMKGPVTISPQEFASLIRDTEAVPARQKN